MDELTPYLVQRGRFGGKSFSEGIDKIIKWDYMGAAEFEFGALGKSLKRIREKLSDYIYTSANIQGKKIIVFANKDISAVEIGKYLSGLANGKFRLKEYSDFDNYITPNPHFPNRDTTDFWWDIKNDIMFWKEDSTFENNFKELISYGK